MKLTPAQLRELQLLAKAPQRTFGSARTRVQNTLVEKGLAKYETIYGDDVCEITAAGYALTL